MNGLQLRIRKGNKSYINQLKTTGQTMHEIQGRIVCMDNHGSVVMPTCFGLRQNVNTLGMCTIVDVVSYLPALDGVS